MYWELKPAIHHIHSGKPCDLIRPVRMNLDWHTHLYGIAYVHNNKTHIMFNLLEMQRKEQIANMLFS